MRLLYTTLWYPENKKRKTIPFFGNTPTVNKIKSEDAFFSANERSEGEGKGKEEEGERKRKPRLSIDEV